MNCKFRMIILACALLTAVAAGSARAGVDINININSGGQKQVAAPPPPSPPPPPPPPPPPWTPRPDAGMIFSYLYYPRLGIYYDFGRELYFYFEGNAWRRTGYRPAFLVNDDRDYVVLDMGEDDPNRYYAQVISHFPPRYFGEEKWERPRHSRWDEERGRRRDRERQKEWERERAEEVEKDYELAKKRSAEKKKDKKSDMEKSLDKVKKLIK